MAYDSTNMPQTLTFPDAIELAMGLADFERSSHFPNHSTFHLERMRLLSERLGEIDSATPTIHIAGTKGKGSVSALVTSILTQSGYRVGLFTSPHLHSVCERIRVGLEPISKDEYAELVRRVWPAVDAVGREGGYGGVTFFELMTAMALVHYRDIGADFQVLEVGLGGRLDATNIVTAPEVSVITSISLDHVATLGDTIAKIAREKAGIIKDGVPCVVAPQSDSAAMRVFGEVAAKHSSNLISVEERFSWKQLSEDKAGQKFSLSGNGSEYRLRTPLLGDYQLENVSTAVVVAELLAESGYAVTADSIAAGVSSVSWPGRFQIFEREGKTIIVDGAHNPYSIGRMVTNLNRYASFERVFLVFGALGGHSMHGMLNALAPLNPRILAVQSRHPRSGRVGAIADAVRDTGMQLSGESTTVADGLRSALEMAQSNDLVLCTGSLALAGEALEELEGIEPEIYENLIGPVNRLPIS